MEGKAVAIWPNEVEPTTDDPMEIRAIQMALDTIA